MNNLEVGSIIKGFRVERIRESAELGGRFVEMRHEKVGSELCWVDNGDANKLFCVGFKTLPEDSTGVFHILEHSVLCGSEKYPVKEPFVDLAKSSMNTFLNAMTFPDKTIYPVSSRNEKDFLNLTEVYLDSVFAPLCVKDPNAFRQEGWRLEVGEDGKPFFNGVVYNEMKGATSGVDDIMYEGMGALLAPDNCYGFNSGGDPAVIPQLTYEAYKAMYNKYYHPSNARIFLDGAVPLEKTLELIDSYLSKAERRDASHVIPAQQPKVSSNTLYYEVGPEEQTENRSMVCFGRIICDQLDKHRCMMADVLAKLLADTNDAPLKRAILEAGLAEDVELIVMDGVAQPALLLFLRNTEADKAADIRRVCEETVNKLVNDGIDKELLTAQINRCAFRLKDAEEPAGLIRCIMSYQSSLYGGDPMLFLENDEDIKALRREAEGRGFDELLSELFDFDKMCTLTVLPSKTYGEKLRQEEQERAEALYAALDEEARAKLTADNDRLHAWQEQQDDPADTAKIPVLPLSDISPEPIFTPTEATEKEGVKVMYHPVPSHGVTHLNLYFNLSDLTLAELSAAKVMTELMTKLPTEEHTAAELQKEIKTYIGALKFDITSASHGRACTPMLAVKCDVLDENLAKAEEIIKEILTATRFDEAARIREILLQLDEASKQYFIMAGHAIGMRAVLSHYLGAAAVSEATGGVTYRGFIKGLVKDYEGKAPELAAVIKKITEESFVRSRLTVGLTATEKPCVRALIESFAEGCPAPAETVYESPVPEKFGVRIPAQVSFAEKGCGMKVTGGMKVAANIISLSHLWSRVRVQGGAYGSGLAADERGAICHYSYRDPSPARSISVYGEEPDFITAFCEGDEALDKFIISAIGNSEPLRSPAEQGAAADIDCMEGKTVEDARRIRREMLETNEETLLALRDDLKACADNGCVCVVGCDSALKEFGDMPVYDV